MTDGPTPHELSERIARLEERMKTMQAEYKTDIARLAEDMARRDAARDTDAARRDAARDTEASRRDARLAERDRAMLLAILGMIALAVAILKFA